jgi:hypothetical protein
MGSSQPGQLLPQLPLEALGIMVSPLSVAIIVVSIVLAILISPLWLLLLLLVLFT